MPMLRAVIASLLALVAIAATAPASHPDWNTVVTVTPQGGHLVGNPAAETKLVEYVSYTCPHCAHFEVEAAGPLQLGFIAPGKGSVEYRSFARNKVDLAVSLLVDCGPVSKFRGNHSLFLRTQDKWFASVSPAQQQRWSSPDFGTAMRAIASDLRLYDLMEQRGYGRVQLDRCLSDRAAGAKIAQQTRVASEDLKIEGTPSFLLNGKLQEAHDWAGLRPQLMEATR